ncbi:hypothetical protein [Jiangella aurantiaca]|uniref:hypothetical protein n=1 Tax=Jiangella aurantiaca TaxID=2530373 RepID=UPI0013A5D1A6|nr:hypothetical protein [Jiangella aurantiaca]
MLPAADYRDAIVKDTNRAEFDELVARADTVTTMPFSTSSGPGLPRRPPTSS